MDPERARELVARERARIERALADLQPDTDDELSHLDQHPADAGSELFTQERDAGLVQRLREELGAVERAEARLEAGTFGKSIESGEPIPDARLEAMPLAERTVEEQARLERGG
jgi:DnaK suppressor protein